MEYEKKERYRTLKIIGTVVTAAALIAVLACLVIASLRSSKASEQLSKLGEKGTQAMPKPEQPDPIAVDGDIPEYDFYEDILWVTESAYADAYNHYMNGYASAEELGEEGILEAFNRQLIDEAHDEALELIKAMKTLVPDLKQKDPLPRTEATAFTDALSMLDEITDVTDSYGSAGTRAVRDELEARTSMRIPLSMTAVIVGVFFIYVIASIIIGTKQQQILSEGRRYRRTTTSTQ